MASAMFASAKEFLDMQGVVAPAWVDTSTTLGKARVVAAVNIINETFDVPGAWEKARELYPDGTVVDDDDDENDGGAVDTLHHPVARGSFAFGDTEGMPLGGAIDDTGSPVLFYEPVEPQHPTDPQPPPPKVHHSAFSAPAKKTGSTLANLKRSLQRAEQSANPGKDYIVGVPPLPPTARHAHAVRRRPGQGPTAGAGAAPPHVVGIDDDVSDGSDGGAHDTWDVSPHYQQVPQHDYGVIDTEALLAEIDTKNRQEWGGPQNPIPVDAGPVAPVLLAVSPLIKPIVDVFNAGVDFPNIHTVVAAVQTLRHPPSSQEDFEAVTAPWTLPNERRAFIQAMATQGRNFTRFQTREAEVLGTALLATGVIRQAITVQHRDAIAAGARLFYTRAAAVRDERTDATRARLQEAKDALHQRVAVAVAGAVASAAAAMKRLVCRTTQSSQMAVTTIDEDFRTLDQQWQSSTSHGDDVSSRTTAVVPLPFDNTNVVNTTPLTRPRSRKGMPAEKGQHVLIPSTRDVHMGMSRVDAYSRQAAKNEGADLAAAVAALTKSICDFLTDADPAAMVPKTDGEILAEVRENALAPIIRNPGEAQYVNPDQKLAYAEDAPLLRVIEALQACAVNAQRVLQAAWASTTMTRLYAAAKVVAAEGFSADEATVPSDAAFARLQTLSRDAVVGWQDAVMAHALRKWTFHVMKLGYGWRLREAGPGFMEFKDVMHLNGVPSARDLSAASARITEVWLQRLEDRVPGLPRPEDYFTAVSRGVDIEFMLDKLDEPGSYVPAVGVHAFCLWLLAQLGCGRFPRGDDAGESGAATGMTRSAVLQFAENTIAAMRGICSPGHVAAVARPALNALVGTMPDLAATRPDSPQMHFVRTVVFHAYRRFASVYAVHDAAVAEVAGAMAVAAACGVVAAIGQAWIMKHCDGVGFTTDPRRKAETNALISRQVAAIMHEVRARVREGMSAYFNIACGLSGLEDAAQILLMQTGSVAPWDVNAGADVGAGDTLAWMTTTARGMMRAPPVDTTPCLVDKLINATAVSADYVKAVGDGAMAFVTMAVHNNATLDTRNGSHALNMSSTWQTQGGLALRAALEAAPLDHPERARVFHNARIIAGSSSRTFLARPDVYPATARSIAQSAYFACVSAGSDFLTPGDVVTAMREVRGLSNVFTLLNEACSEDPEAQWNFKSHVMSLGAAEQALDDEDTRALTAVGVTDTDAGLPSAGAAAAPSAEEGDDSSSDGLDVVLGDGEDDIPPSAVRSDAARAESRQNLIAVKETLALTKLLLACFSAARERGGALPAFPPVFRCVAPLNQRDATRHVDLETDPDPSTLFIDARLLYARPEFAAMLRAMTDPDTEEETQWTSHDVMGIVTYITMQMYATAFRIAHAQNNDDDFGREVAAELMRPNYSVGRLLTHMLLTLPCAEGGLADLPNLISAEARPPFLIHAAVHSVNLDAGLRAATHRVAVNRFVAGALTSARVLDTFMNTSHPTALVHGAVELHRGMKLYKAEEDIDPDADPLPVFSRGVMPVGALTEAVRRAVFSSFQGHRGIAHVPGGKRFDARGFRVPLAPTPGFALALAKGASLVQDTLLEPPAADVTDDFVTLASRLASEVTELRRAELPTARDMLRTDHEPAEHVPGGLTRVAAAHPFGSQKARGVVVIVPGGSAPPPVIMGGNLADAVAKYLYKQAPDGRVLARMVRRAVAGAALGNLADLYTTGSPMKADPERIKEEAKKEVDDEDEAEKIRNAFFAHADAARPPENKVVYTDLAADVQMWAACIMLARDGATGAHRAFYGSCGGAPPVRHMWMTKTGVLPEPVLHLFDAHYDEAAEKFTPHNPYTGDDAYVRGFMYDKWTGVTPSFKHDNVAEAVSDLTPDVVDASVLLGHPTRPPFVVAKRVRILQEALQRSMAPAVLKAALCGHQSDAAPALDMTYIVSKALAVVDAVVNVAKTTLYGDWLWESCEDPYARPRAFARFTQNILSVVRSPRRRVIVEVAALQRQLADGSAARRDELPAVVAALDTLVASLTPLANVNADTDLTVDEIDVLGDAVVEAQIAMGHGVPTLDTFEDRFGSLVRLSKYIKPCVGDFTSTGVNILFAAWAVQQDDTETAIASVGPLLKFFSGVADMVTNDHLLAPKPHEGGHVAHSNLRAAAVLEMASALDTLNEGVRGGNAAAEERMPPEVIPRLAHVVHTTVNVLLTVALVPPRVLDDGHTDPPTSPDGGLQQVWPPGTMGGAMSGAHHLGLIAGMQDVVHFASAMATADVSTWWAELVSALMQTQDKVWPLNSLALRYVAVDSHKMPSAALHAEPAPNVADLQTPVATAQARLVAARADADPTNRHKNVALFDVMAAARPDVFAAANPGVDVAEVGKRLTSEDGTMVAIPYQTGIVQGSSPAQTAWALNKMMKKLPHGLDGSVAQRASMGKQLEAWMATCGYWGSIVHAARPVGIGDSPYGTPSTIAAAAKELADWEYKMPLWAQNNAGWTRVVSTMRHFFMEYTDVPDWMTPMKPQPAMPGLLEHVTMEHLIRPYIVARFPGINMVRTDMSWVADRLETDAEGFQVPAASDGGKWAPHVLPPHKHADLVFAGALEIDRADVEKEEARPARGIRGHNAPLPALVMNETERLNSVNANPWNTGYRWRCLPVGNTRLLRGALSAATLAATSTNPTGITALLAPISQFDGSTSLLQAALLHLMPRVHKTVGRVNAIQEALKAAVAMEKWDDVALAPVVPGLSKIASACVMMSGLVNVSAVIPPGGASAVLARADDGKEAIGRMLVDAKNMFSDTDNVCYAAGFETALWAADMVQTATSNGRNLDAAEAVMGGTKAHAHVASTMKTAADASGSTLLDTVKIRSAGGSRGLGRIALVGKPGLETTSRGLWSERHTEPRGNEVMMRQMAGFVPLVYPALLRAADVQNADRMLQHATYRVRDLDKPNVADVLGFTHAVLRTMVPLFGNAPLTGAAASIAGLQERFGLRGCRSQLYEVVPTALAAVLAAQPDPGESLFGLTAALLAAQRPTAGIPAWYGESLTELCLTGALMAAWPPGAKATVDTVLKWMADNPHAGTCDATWPDPGEWHGSEDGVTRDEFLRALWQMYSVHRVTAGLQTTQYNDAFNLRHEDKAKVWPGVQPELVAAGTMLRLEAPSGSLSGAADNLYRVEAPVQGVTDPCEMLLHLARCNTSTGAFKGTRGWMLTASIVRRVFAFLDTPGEHDLVAASAFEALSGFTMLGAHHAFTEIATLVQPSGTSGVMVVPVENMAGVPGAYHWERSLTGATSVDNIPTVDTFHCAGPARWQIPLRAFPFSVSTLTGMGATSAAHVTAAANGNALGTSIVFTAASSSVREGMGMSAGGLGESMYTAPDQAGGIVVVDSHSRSGVATGAVSTSQEGRDKHGFMGWHSLNPGSLAEAAEVGVRGALCRAWGSINTENVFFSPVIEIDNGPDRANVMTRVRSGEMCPGLFALAWDYLPPTEVELTTDVAATVDALPHRMAYCKDHQDPEHARANPDPNPNALLAARRRRANLRSVAAAEFVSGVRSAGVIGTAAESVITGGSTLADANWYAGTAQSMQQRRTFMYASTRAQRSRNHPGMDPQRTDIDPSEGGSAIAMGTSRVHHPADARAWYPEQGVGAMLRAIVRNATNIDLRAMTDVPEPFARTSGDAMILARFGTGAPGDLQPHTPLDPTTITSVLYGSAFLSPAFGRSTFNAPSDAMASTGIAHRVHPNTASMVNAVVNRKLGTPIVGGAVLRRSVVAPTTVRPTGVVPFPEFGTHSAIDAQVQVLAAMAMGTPKGSRPSWDMASGLVPPVTSLFMSDESDHGLLSATNVMAAQACAFLNLAAPGRIDVPARPPPVSAALFGDNNVQTPLDTITGPGLKYSATGEPYPTLVDVAAGAKATRPGSKRGRGADPPRSSVHATRPPTKRKGKGKGKGKGKAKPRDKPKRNMGKRVMSMEELRRDYPHAVGASPPSSDELDPHDADVVLSEEEYVYVTPTSDRSEQ